MDGKNPARTPGHSNGVFLFCILSPSYTKILKFPSRHILQCIKYPARTNILFNAVFATLKGATLGDNLLFTLREEKQQESNIRQTDHILNMTTSTFHILFFLQTQLQEKETT